MSRAFLPPAFIGVVERGEIDRRPILQQRLARSARLNLLERLSHLLSALKQQTLLNRRLCLNQEFSKERLLTLPKAQTEGGLRSGTEERASYHFHTGWIKKGRERIRVGRATGRPRCIEGAGRAARDQIFGTGAGWAVRPADLSLRALSQGFSLTRGGVDRCSTARLGKDRSTPGIEISLPADPRVEAGGVHHIKKAPPLFVLSVGSAQTLDSEKVGYSLYIDGIENFRERMKQRERREVTRPIE
ncbi:hypothetical protein NE237_014212 [Protea cynaroides]|uniref:Uncharacterized protein n=1 Tax=Protea cynaroides TaxID=273540 RepID=A0A9Q0GL52_9MAGN|nr:hypothetical protein NE237_014212 [Protea cynaroides]